MMYAHTSQPPCSACPLSLVAHSPWRASGLTPDSPIFPHQVEFRGDKVVTTAYMDDFPFPYYVALQVRRHLADRGSAMV